MTENRDDPRGVRQSDSSIGGPWTGYWRISDAALRVPAEKSLESPTRSDGGGLTNRDREGPAGPANSFSTNLPS